LYEKIVGLLHGEAGHPDSAPAAGQP
jgi:hypothetical protein